MSEKAISSTTQEFLDVYDIVNDMVLLKDGTASIILQVGTMNFSLLAEQEQDAIIFTYGSLLNSLNYPIQISIQSQTKDVTKYLRLLDEQIQKASSDRKAILIKQYRNFVAALIKERNVLEKHFYITVPAGPAEMGLITPSSVLPGKTAFDITTVEKSIILEKAANILEPRRDHLTAQFNRLGLYTRQLNTQEIIQNFYINYNPEAAEGQEISNNENYTTPLVRASFGGKIMQTNNPAQSPTPEEILSNKPIEKSVPTQQITPASQQVESVQVEPISTEAPAAQPMQTESLETKFAEPTQPIAPELSEPIQTETTQSVITPVETSIPQTEVDVSQASLEIPQTEVGSLPAQAEQPIEETNNIVNNTSLNLNLDPNLINNSQPEQIPVFDPNEQIDNLTSDTQLESTPSISPTPTEEPQSAPILQQAIEQTEQVVEQAMKTPNPVEAQDNFAEEITPLQSKFEQPIINKINSVGEKNTPAQS